MTRVASAAAGWGATIAAVAALATSAANPTAMRSSLFVVM
jgi:hypothetical protein